MNSRRGGGRHAQPWRNSKRSRASVRGSRSDTTRKAVTCVYSALGRAAKTPYTLGSGSHFRPTPSPPPRFLSAESIGRAFLAHDEPSLGKRAITQVYDGQDGTLNDLAMGPTDDPASVKVKFRGVVAWRDYLVGWGFDDGTDERPDYVRVSLPAEPDTFLPEHYWLAGDRGSPVVSVKPSGSTLVVLKPASSFLITGGAWDDFGIRPLYELFGALASRLAITVEGIMYAWGFEGPWATTVGSTSDLESMLDLERVAPADLPSASLAKDAFAVYLPVERVIEWHWGDRIYALELDEEGSRWSYRTRGARAACGALLYTQSTALVEVSRDPPTGYARIDTVDATGPVGTLQWDNISQDGNEVLEIWLREGGMGQWEQFFPSQNITLASRQKATLTDLIGGVIYTVAIRYRRGGQYALDFAHDDPEQWPQDARREFTVTPAAPVLNMLTWRRVTQEDEVVEGVFTPIPGQEGLEHRVAQVGNSIEVSVQPLDQAGQTPGDTSESVGRFRVSEFATETDVEFYVYAVADTGNSAPSNTVSIYTGPPSPTDATYAVRMSESGMVPIWNINWTNAPTAENANLLFETWLTLVEVVGVHAEAVGHGVSFLQIIGGVTADDGAPVRVRHFTGLGPLLFDESPWISATLRD